MAVDHSGHPDCVFLIQPSLVTNSKSDADSFSKPRLVTVRVHFSTVMKSVISADTVISPDKIAMK